MTLIKPISDIDVLLSEERAVERARREGQPGRPSGPVLPSFLRLSASGRGHLGALHLSRSPCGSCGQKIFACGSIICPTCHPERAMRDVLSKVLHR